MAKRKATEVETESEATPEPAAYESINKANAVRRALAAGFDMPSTGVAYIKEEFGIEITTQMFSSYKTSEKKKAQEEGEQPAAPKTRAVAEAPASKAEKKATKSAPSDASAAEFARQVKMLVDLYGADAVKDMATVFTD